MTHSFFFKLTIGECKESFKLFRTLLSLSKKWKQHANVIFLQYLLEMIVLLLFSQRRLLSVRQKLTKRIRTNYVTKNTFSFTSQWKISWTLVKTVAIQDLHRSRKFTCYFSRKKRFMRHPQFLLHKRHLREHLQKSTFGPALCCQHFLCFILRNRSIQMTVVHVSKACGSSWLVNKCSVLAYISQLVRYPTIQSFGCKRDNKPVIYK